MARSKSFSLLSVLTGQQEDTKIFQAQVPGLSVLAMPSLQSVFPPEIWVLCLGCVSSLLISKGSQEDSRLLNAFLY